MKVDFNAVRTDAGDIMVEQLEMLLKKIPKRGLNNLTRQTYWYPENDEWKWLKDIPFTPKPTIRRRMDKLCPPFGILGLPYLPPPMVAMANKEAKKTAKVLLNQCLDELFAFIRKLDTITVVDKSEVEEFKRRVQRLMEYLNTTAEALGMVIEEGEVSEEVKE